MITLREAVQEYLTLRRDMGFKLLQAGQLLHQAVSYMEAQNASHVTLDLALQWAMQPKDAKPATWASRLMVWRSFARHHSAADPCTEIPPNNLLPYRPNRAKPYLYTERDIERLMIRARALPAEGGWVGQTYACLLGLLAVTGMRIGEAIALEIRDADLTAGILIIRQAKFGRSRLIPLHPSSQQALLQYAQRRDTLLRRKTAARFFVSRSGRPLCTATFRQAFHTICGQIGLHRSETWDKPQLHHFRHRFAMTTLLHWYQSGEDVEKRLPVLSTFLGHVSIADTYWYLSARPELMREAVRRLERRWEKAP